MGEPKGSDNPKGRGEREKVRSLLCDGGKEPFIGLHLTQLGDLEFERQKGDGDGKDGVAEKDDAFEIKGAFGFRVGCGETHEK